MKRISFLLLLAVSLIGCPSGDTPTVPEATEAGSGDEAETPAADEAEASPEADEPASQPEADEAPSAAGAAEGSGRNALIRAANPSRMQLQQPQLRLEPRGMGRDLRLAPTPGGGAAPTLQLQPVGE